MKTNNTLFTAINTVKLNLLYFKKITLFLFSFYP